MMIEIWRVIHIMFKQNRPPTLVVITKEINEDDKLLSLFFGWGFKAKTHCGHFRLRLPSMNRATIHRYIVDLGFVDEC